MLLHSYLLNDWMFCVANDEYIFQIATNNIKVKLSCLKHHRFDLILVISYMYIEIFH